MNMEKEIKYFIYCRKSSEARDRQALSIEAQKRELKEYADRYSLVIVDILEESQSAYKGVRPVFEKMMSMCEEGLANGIITWKADRLARNARDGGRVIQALDDKILLEICTPDQVFKQEDNRMIMYMMFGMSNDFSRQIGTNVRRGNRQKYVRGEFLGRAPVGYLNAHVGIYSNIVPDPIKAPLVIKSFEEYATGNYSVSALAEMINKWGLTSINDNPMCKSGVYSMLRRPVYYGVFKHSGEFHQGIYEPLISKELFDKVQKILDDRSKPKHQNWTHTYIGLIKCPECGCAITATTKRKLVKKTGQIKNYTFYHCTKRKSKCAQSPVTKKEMESMIKENISKIIIEREVWELGVKLLRAKSQHQLEANLDIKTKLELELTSIEKKLGKLLDMRLNEQITSQEYADMKKLLIDRKIKLKEKSEDREQSASNWLELAEKFFETAVQAREILETGSDEEKRNLVKAVGSNLYLRNKKLEFSFRKPYDVLLQPVMRSNVQAKRGSKGELKANKFILSAARLFIFFRKSSGVAS